MTKEEDIKTKQKRDSERIASLTLMDDVFMSKVFEDKQCVEVLLQAILDKKDLTVVNVEVQRSIASLQGRSVRIFWHMTALERSTTSKCKIVTVERRQSAQDTTAAC
mgnify:CR=1 FL=1